jgi:hypothetical protein
MKPALDSFQCAVPVPRRCCTTRKDGKICGRKTFSTHPFVLKSLKPIRAPGGRRSNPLSPDHLYSMTSELTSSCDAARLGSKFTLR